MFYNDRNWTSLSFLLLAAFAASARAGDDEPSLFKSVAFYASFDERLAGDVGGGDLSLSTRMNHETEKGKFVFTKGYNQDVFRVARNKGVHGGALEAVDVLPRNGRIFFPAKGNIAYRKGGWGGAVSFWLNTDPNKLLKTAFCDPVQITEKGAGNGGVWCDFPDVKPRDMRLGAFPAVPEGQTPIPESDPMAPLVVVKDVGFKVGDWHHVVLSWKNFDTGKDDARAALYVDGKFIGELSGREIAMNWNLDKAGIYVAVSYIGLLDEFAVFNRSLTADEIALLHREPGLLAPLAKKDGGDRQSAAPTPPRFPFDTNEAKQYQRAYADWSGLPLEVTNDLGMTFVLIPPGTFTMGSPEAEAGHNSGGYDETQHGVTLTRPFYLSKHETNVGQFRRFVEATNFVTDGERNGGGHAHDEKAVWIHRPGTQWRKPGYAGPFELRDEHPVVHVSHTDSKGFCQWLQKESGSVKQRHPDAKFVFDLPTEAQWEWACRAGSGARYWWGEDEDTSGKVANVGDRTLKRVHPDWPRQTMPMDDGHAFSAPVGSFQANAFGLHDMLGNVWEFCSSRYDPYPREAVTDPEHGDPKRGFAVRGGGWSNIPTDARCASRNADPPHFCHSNLGFRVAMVLRDVSDDDSQRAAADNSASDVSADDVMAGLREFYRKTARPDGSFQPGIDPDYLGMSDSAYSDMAAVTYAVTIHKTFGWKLPYEKKTAEFLLARQKDNGDFFNTAGTVDPASAQGRVYNTTQGLVALHALGLKPRHNPLPVFEEILKQDYKTLPAYSTSFFPLAYLCYGQPIPSVADRKIRAMMVQTDDGYLNDHVAATFHAAHYYRLVGEPTPMAKQMLDRMVRDQKPDGSWMLNAPARDRHATFDAVFTLRQLGQDREDCRAAINRAARWVLACRNTDGGFGHFPGSTSDADANYFQVGALVMAGFLKPADPLPKNPQLLSWGHLMPAPSGKGHDVGSADSNSRSGAPQSEEKQPPSKLDAVEPTSTRANSAQELATLKLPAWVGSVAFSPDSRLLATGSADNKARLWDVSSAKEQTVLAGHDDYVVSVAFSPDGKTLATGSFDHTARLWDIESRRTLATLRGHRGAVMSVAFSADGKQLASGSIDGTVKLWETSTGQLLASLAGHKSWVNAVTFSPRGNLLASASSDGTIKLWSAADFSLQATWQSTNAEIRSLAFSPDGASLAAGLRYGKIQVWDVAAGKKRLDFQAHEEDVWSLAFTPDGQTIISGNGAWNQPGQVKLWQAATAQPLGSLLHSGEVLSVAVSPNSESISAGGWDRTIRVWTIGNGQSRR